MKEINRIFKNLFSIGTAKCIEIFAGLLTISLIARFLGVLRYSEYALIMTYVGVLMSLTFAGVEMIIIREIAKKKDVAHKYLGAAFIIRWLLSFVVLILLTAIVPFLHLKKEMIEGIYIIAFAHLIMSSSLLYQAVFKAFERMEYETLLSLAFHVTLLSSVFFVIHMNLGFISVFWCFFLANTIRLILAVVITHRKFVVPEIRIIEEIPFITFLLKSSMVVGVYIILMHVSLNIDIILLKIFSKDIDVSLFYAAHSIIKFLSIFPVILLTVLMPVLSRQSLSESSSDLFATYQTSFKVLVVAGLFLAVNLFVFSEEFIKLIFREDFQHTTFALQIMTLSILPIFIIILTDQILIAKNLERYLILFASISLAIKVVCGLILIPMFGYIGASIASTSGFFSLFMISFTFVSRKCFMLPLKSILLKPTVASLLLGLFIFYLKENGHIFFLLIAGVVVYFLIIYLLKIFSDEEVFTLKNFGKNLLKI
jgi:O-antigen/teichoic acid export membrane protein